MITKRFIEFSDAFDEFMSNGDEQRFRRAFKEYQKLSECEKLLLLEKAKARAYEGVLKGLWGCKK